MCWIWDWQSKIVKDHNDSQDPKHTLFVAKSYLSRFSRFSDNKCPLFTRFFFWGGGRPKRTSSASPPSPLQEGFPYMRIFLTWPVQGTLMWIFCHVVAPNFTLSMSGSVSCSFELARCMTHTKLCELRQQQVCGRYKFLSFSRKAQMQLVQRRSNNRGEYVSEKS